MDRKLRIQVIGAHPDDPDFKCSGIAFRYARLGHQVQFVSATNGNAGHQELGGAKLAQVRLSEAQAVAKRIGISYLLLDNDDAYLETDVRTREKIVRTIREFAPDVIITHRPFDYHPDHRNTGVLVQDASYLVKVPNFCKITAPLRYQPIILYMQDGFTKPLPFQADIVVDTSDLVEEMVQVLDCHKSQFYEWLPWVGGYEDQLTDDPQERLNIIRNRHGMGWRRMADTYREQLISRYGEQRAQGVTACEAFEICEYGGKLAKEDIDTYFPF